jgi:hypothetical protein
MKQLSKKILTGILITVLGLTALTACSKEELTPANEIASAFYKLFILGDSEDAKTLFAYTDEDIETFTNTQRDGSIAIIKSNLSAIGSYSPTDEEAAVMYDAQMEAFKKLTFSTEVTSETSDTAVVTLKTNYFDIMALDEQAANEALEEFGAENIIDEASTKEFILLYIQKFESIIKSAEPSEDQAEVTISFEKAKTDVGGKTKVMWVPQDASGFGEDIINAVSGS